MRTRNIAASIILLLFLVVVAHADTFHLAEADRIQFTLQLTEADTIHFTGCVTPVNPGVERDGRVAATTVVLEHSCGSGTGTLDRCPTAACDTSGVFHHGDFPVGGFVPGSIEKDRDEVGSIVPEPSTTLLICTGLLGLTGAIKRKLLG